MPPRGEIVVDTNVWIHAGNAGVTYHQEALEFCERLQQSDEHICFDISDTRLSPFSMILEEYLERVVHGTYGAYLIAHLLKSGRFLPTIDSLTDSQRSTIGALLSQNARDRTFAVTARSSSCHSLISHDFVDFTDHVRTELWRKIRLRCETSREFLNRIASSHP